MSDTAKTKLAVPNDQASTTPVSFQKADQQLSSCRIESSIELFKKIIQANQPERQHEVLGWGSVAEQKSCYEKSIIEWYREQRNLKKEAVTAYDCLCLCYTIQKNYQDPQQYYNRMLQRYPQNSALLLSLAHIHFNHGMIHQAKSNYEKLLKSSKQKKHAHKQLAILAFYEDNRAVICHHLNQLKQYVDRDYTLKFLQTFVEPSKQQQLALYDELIAQYPHYVRSYTFKAYTLESINRHKEAHQCYHDCIKHNKKYSIPYIQLAFSYFQQSRSQEAIDLLKNSLSQKWDDDILIYIFLSFLHFKNQQYSESKKHAQNLLNSVIAKKFSFNSQTKRFLQKFIRHVIKLIEKKEKGKIDIALLAEQLNKWQDLILEIHSIKQQHLNCRVHIILKKQLQPIQITKFYFSNNYQLDQELMSKFLCSNVSQAYLIQLTNALMLKSVKNGVLCGKSIVDLNKEISTFLALIADYHNQKESIVSQTIVNQSDDSLKVYSTQYKPKSYNMLQDKQYFNDFKHLNLIFKEFCRQVKMAKKYAQDMVKDVISVLSPTYHKLQTRFDSFNFELATIQVMIEILPEICQKKLQLMQRIGKAAQKAKKAQYQDLIESFRGQAKKELQRIIKEKFQTKTPTTCSISNWIQLWFFFKNKKQLVEAIQLIKQSCKDKGYQIHGFEGDKYLGFQSRIQIRIKIYRVCATIHLALDRNYRNLFFKNYVKSTVKHHLGPLLKNLIDFKKKYKDSLSLYFQEYIEYENLESNEQNQQMVIQQKVSQFSRQLKNQETEYDTTLIDQQQLMNQTGERLSSMHRKAVENTLMQDYSKLVGNQQISFDQLFYARKRSENVSDSSRNGSEILNQSYHEATLKNEKVSFELKYNRGDSRQKTQNNEQHNGRRFGLVDFSRQQSAKSQIISNEISINQQGQKDGLDEQISELKRGWQLEKLQLTRQIEMLKLANSQLKYRLNQQSNKNQRLQTQLNKYSEQYIKLKQQWMDANCQIQLFKQQNQKLKQQNQKLLILKQELGLKSQAFLRLKDQQLKRQADQFKRKFDQLQSKCFSLKSEKQQMSQKNSQLIKQLDVQFKKQNDLHIKKEKDFNSRNENSLKKLHQTKEQFQSFRRTFQLKQTEVTDANRFIEDYKIKIDNYTINQRFLRAEIQQWKKKYVLMEGQVGRRKKEELKIKEASNNQFQNVKKLFDKTLHNQEQGMQNKAQKGKLQNFQKKQAMPENKKAKERKDKVQINQTITQAREEDHNQVNNTFNKSHIKQTKDIEAQTLDVKEQQITIQNETKAQSTQRQPKCQEGELCKTAKRLTKKVEYLTIVFAILFFQAITLTFTTKMLQ